MTTRVFPPARGPFSCPAFGRNYSANPGTYLDVPDQDAQILGANGWTSLGLVGTTAQRPANIQTTPPQPFAGQEYLDTSIAAVIFFDGAAWRNPLTGAAV